VIANRVSLWTLLSLEVCALGGLVLESRSINAVAVILIFVVPLVLFTVPQTIAGLRTPLSVVRRTSVAVQWPLFGALIGIGAYAAFESGIPGAALITGGFVAGFWSTASLHRRHHLPARRGPLALWWLIANTFAAIVALGLGIEFLSNRFVS
jgi:hypothetical protein